MKMSSRVRHGLALGLFFAGTAMSFAAQRTIVFSNVHTVEQTGDVIGEHLVLRVGESGAVRGALRTYEGSYDVETVPLTGKLIRSRLVLYGRASYGNVAIEGTVGRGHLDATIKRNNGCERVRLPQEKQEIDQ